MKIAGVDPGNSGGISIIDGDSVVGVIPMPTHEVTPVKKTYTFAHFELISKFLKENSVEKLYIELVGARPHQGGVSMFNFGFSTGGIHGVCASLGIELLTVRPQVWKEVIFGKGESNEKEYAINFCKQNFPKISLMPTKRSKVPSDGMAEAICIGVYGLRDQKLKAKEAEKEIINNNGNKEAKQ